jgi:hypothetical protein
MTSLRPNDFARRSPNVVLALTLVALLAGCPERSAGDARDAALIGTGNGSGAAGQDLQSATVPPPRVDTLPRDSIADLPRATVDTRYVVPTGQVIRVDARGNLQSALNKAQPGDVVMLASGATYVGNYTLPTRRCGTGAITVRTDIADSLLPPVGQRMNPSYAPRLAKIVTRNSTAALKTSNPTCGWRIMGLEISASPELSGSTVNYGLLLLGDGGWRGGGDNQTSLSRVPSRLIVDRVFVHGLAGTNTVRCIALNGAQSAIIDSWISDCHAKGFDSQAIEGWNGPGPYLIENNFLAGAGENVMFGGADPGIENLIPADITIRRNHFYKDPAWKGVWTVKNLFELKSAQRVLVEGNVFENCWADAQAGMAIVIKSSTGNQAGQANWQGTTDVTFRYNLVKNSPRGFNVQAADGPTDLHVARVRAENNLFENIGHSNGTGTDGWLMLLTHDLRDVSIRHNTFVHNVPNFGIALVMDYGEGRAKHLTITDNVFTSPAGYAVFYSGTKVGIESLRAMAGDSWKFEHNVVAGVEAQFAPWHPPQNWYPPTVAGIGFVDPVVSDYRLSAKSPFKAHSRDGSDPGVDMARMRKETAGVVQVDSTPRAR